MELAVKHVQIPERIEFNYEELKTQILDLTAKYSGIAYTEDQIKEAKADKAKLSKLKKTMNDERIRLERDYMAPFTEFKDQVNDLIKIVDGPIREIDGQLKRYEEDRKARKEEEILRYIDSIGGVPGSIAPEKLFSTKWLNATYSMNAIKGEIVAAIDQIRENLDTLNSLEEFSINAILVYQDTLSLPAALAEVKRQKNIRAMNEEAERRRAEREAERRIDTTVQIPVTPADPPEMREPEPEEDPRQWVSFAAFLTIHQARMLRSFFEMNEIEFKAI